MLTKEVKMESKQLINWLTHIIVEYKKEYDWKADDNIYFGDIIGKLALLEKLKKELQDDWVA